MNFTFTEIISILVLFFTFFGVQIQVFKMLLEAKLVPINEKLTNHITDTDKKIDLLDKKINDLSKIVDKEFKKIDSNFDSILKVFKTRGIIDVEEKQ